MSAPGIREIIFPTDCTTPRQKTEWLYRAQEKLRLLHNQFVLWKESGLPKAEWEALPKNMKMIYPYQVQLSATAQKQFIEDEFMPRSQAIAQAITEQRAFLKASTKWDMDVGEI